jgi:hypothetical protein
MMNENNLKRKAAVDLNIPQTTNAGRMSAEDNETAPHNLPKKIKGLGNLQDMQNDHFPKPLVSMQQSVGDQNKGLSSLMPGFKLDLGLPLSTSFQSLLTAPQIVPQTLSQPPTLQTQHNVLDLEKDLPKPKTPYTKKQWQKLTNGKGYKAEVTFPDQFTIQQTDDIAFKTNKNTKTTKELQSEFNSQWMLKPQQGQFIGNQTLDKVDSANYAGNRTMQISSQLSEMTYPLLHNKSGKNPVEVQFSYAHEQDRLLVSTNNMDTQQYLFEQMKPGGTLTPNKIVENSLSSNSHQRQIAQKFMLMDEQNKRRETNNGSKEDKNDLNMATNMRNAFAKGNVTVIMNSGERHAEQNINHYAKQNDVKITDPGGTMTRCASCTLELGTSLQTQVTRKNESGNMVQTKLPVSGNLFQAQTEKSPKELGEGNHLFMNTSSRRPRSTSPVLAKYDGK